MEKILSLAVGTIHIKKNRFLPVSPQNPYTHECIYACREYTLNNDTHLQVLLYVSKRLTWITVQDDELVRLCGSLGEARTLTRCCNQPQLKKQKRRRIILEKPDGKNEPPDSSEVQ